MHDYDNVGRIYLPILLCGINISFCRVEGRIEKSASLVMPNGDPRDGFFYPTLTLMNLLYVLTICNGNHDNVARIIWQVLDALTPITRFYSKFLCGKINRIKN